MISVIIPTLNAENDLPTTLNALIPAAISGIVKEVIVVDGGSHDHTVRIADNAGAKIITSEKGRGKQLNKGATQALSPWLLFLHADTELTEGWERAVNLLKIAKFKINKSMQQPFNSNYQMWDGGQDY